jgi:hypothetical protein
MGVVVKGKTGRKRPRDASVIKGNDNQQPRVKNEEEKNLVRTVGKEATQDESKRTTQVRFPCLFLYTLLTGAGRASHAGMTPPMHHVGDGAGHPPAIRKRVPVTGYAVVLCLPSLSTTTHDAQRDINPYASNAHEYAFPLP